MINPDFWIADDENAHLDVWEAYWAHWRGVLHQPADSANAFYRSLFELRYVQPSADLSELFDGFEQEHGAFARMAYRCSDGRCDDFRLLAPTDLGGETAIYGLWLVHPFATARVTTATYRWRRRISWLTVCRVDQDEQEPLGCFERLTGKLVKAASHI